ncbi:hypothetical protein BDN70DRAFT_189402 [Pholiota conissans]|uniref:C2H2-type domain-containing protein n=1 Tax=Pholiota conissans TaxID=109636 RepID=A0A9P5YVD2_9AGAR|nr:hypothetical protein BDN70DRAFT_189402 [Pholiota conissans]
MRSLPTSKATFKCRWADCEIDLTHSNRSFAHHIVEDHRLEPTHVCEWESCFKKGYPFSSTKELILHVQSEHTKTKYFRCSQQDCDLYFQHESALKYHQLRDHEQAASSRSSSRNASKISLYNPGSRQPDHLRRVFSLSSLKIPGTGSQSALEISQTLVQHSLIQTVQKV